MVEGQEERKCGKDRFSSFEKAKDLMKRRIVDSERTLFGQARTGSLIDRLSHLEQSMGIAQNSNSLKKERLDSLEEVIESKSETIEEHEMDLFGEITKGSLKERWMKLQEWQF